MDEKLESQQAVEEALTALSLDFRLNSASLTEERKNLKF